MIYYFKVHGNMIKKYLVLSYLLYCENGMIAINELILKDIMLDIQVVNPTLPINILGDFNTVLENRDGINRNANLNEVNAISF